MVVLGIDPGISNLGLGVVAREGQRYQYLWGQLVRTTHGDPAPLRVGQIHQAVRAVLHRFEPQAIAVEEQFFYRQNELAYKIGWAMGAVMVASHEAGIPLVGYGPMKIKQAVVGFGHADKAQVAFMVRAVLGMKENPRPTHVADALAIALAHLFHGGLGGNTL